MSRYRLLGFLRCRYRKRCGPDSETAMWGSSEEENEKDERTCFTWRHFFCPEYRIQRKKESGERGRIEGRKTDPRFYL